MSTLVGSMIDQVQSQHPEMKGAEIGGSIAIICGAIVTFMGLFGLGFIVDFIPLPAISAFMTGSALNICSGQVSKMLGETAQFDSKGATYEIIINTLKYLPTSTLDAAVGITAMVMLYVIRYACNYGAKKHPGRAKIFFFASTLRTVFVILLYTMIGAAVNLHRKDNPAFSLLGHVPRGKNHLLSVKKVSTNAFDNIGFQDVGAPRMDPKMISAYANQLPAAVIVLLIEHIAISKSFGRVNNYSIDPSQELVAIGVSNLLGPFLGAYPATGSFSRTAIKSKAGVRTPLAGCITAVVVLLAIYALTEVFYYIPQASLAGVIIHAVGDLITPPNTVYQFWRVSPLDAIIFFIGVIVSVFSTIEVGIYCTVAIAAAVLLFRVAKARGQFLGRVTIHSVVGDHLVDGEGKYGTIDTKGLPSDDEDRFHRSIFLPVDHTDGTNPEIEVEQPFPGIFIYRFSEGFNYPNANHYTDYLVQTIFQHTRRTNPFTYAKQGDRPWNHPGPRKGKQEPDRSHLPTLRAIVLDFSSVNNVDATSIQNLIDVRNQLDLYASPDTVQWHFAHINNRWTKRALAAAGFGYPTPVSESGFKRWKPIFSVAEIEGSSSAAAHAEIMNHEREARQAERQRNDIESNYRSNADVKSQPETIEHETQDTSDEKSSQDDKFSRDLEVSKAYQERPRVAVVQGLNRPFFHIDLTSALQSAIANASQHDPTALLQGQTS